MTTNKRKKNSRAQGSHTHGWGSMKKHRGSGHKGGVGMAGTGKRGDAKKPSIWKADKKGVKYFGRHGFLPPQQKIVKSINIAILEQKLQQFVDEKIVKEENGKYLIELDKLGYNKLLGTGKATKKMVIKVAAASSGAAQSIKEAGGEVQLPTK